jgi:cytoskeleton-associated protein 5
MDNNESSTSEEELFELTAHSIDDELLFSPTSNAKNELEKRSEHELPATDVFELSESPLFNVSPIAKPAAKSTCRRNILKELEEEAIDLVITHISHQKIDISVQNLVQIDVVIKDRDKKDLLIPHIDNLLNTCAVKLNVAHNVYLNSQDCHVDEIFKLFKSLFSVIIGIFESELGKHANTKTLKDVFYNLLCVMTDAKILNCPDGDQLYKAINIVTIKLLDLSDQTTSYCALLKLLSECCNDENFSSKYLEILMKCIWRQIKRLSSSDTNPAAQQEFENRVQQIDTSRVFGEIRAFFKMYPSSSWQSKSSDLPFITVKTLLFHLAKAKQSQVLDDLNKIRVPDDSEIKVFIMKLFSVGFQLPDKAFGGPAKTKDANGNYEKFS